MDLKRQASAPLYEAIEKFRKKRIVPFDVPGHKRGRGNPELVDLLGERCVGIDVNSMKPLDNLCHPVSVIKEACEHGDENYIIQNHTELIADYCSILDGLSKYVTVGEEKNPVQKLSAAIDNFDQAEAMKLLEMIKNEMGSSMADSDTQLIADMEAQIELFDFISAAETLKKWGGADNE